jgi:hypothetical protein
MAGTGRGDAHWVIAKLVVALAVILTGAALLGGQAVGKDQTRSSSDSKPTSSGGDLG